MYQIIINALILTPTDWNSCVPIKTTDSITASYSHNYMYYLNKVMYLNKKYKNINNVT